MEKQNRMWPLVVTIVAAVGSFLLSRVIWPDMPGMAGPEGAQLPLFIGVGIAESLAFGIGVSFLIFMWPMLKGRSTGEWFAYLSAAWLLVSWWPHDNLHRVMQMGDNWQLLRLEWGFHVTLIIAGVILASHLWKEWSQHS